MSSTTPGDGKFIVALYDPATGRATPKHRFKTREAAALYRRIKNNDLGPLKSWPCACYIVANEWSCEGLTDEALRPAPPEPVTVLVVGTGKRRNGHVYV